MYAALATTSRGLWATQAGRESWRTSTQPTLRACPGSPPTATEATATTGVALKHNETCMYLVALAACCSNFYLLSSRAVTVVSLLRFDFVLPSGNFYAARRCRC